MSILNKQKAFTLIELLVVIAIISILTGIILSNFSGARSKTRDTKRVSDLSQLQLALELFFDRCNQYPAVSGSGMPNIDDGSNCPTGITLKTFISQIPTPPSPGVYTYGLKSDNADYVLMAPLENNNTILLDDTDGTLYSIDCAESLVSPFKYNYCVQPK